MRGTPTFDRGFLTHIKIERASFHPGNRWWLTSPLLRLVTDIEALAAGIGDRGAELLAASDNVTGVRRLALLTSSVGNRGATAIANSPSLAGLACLVLTNGRIGDAGAIALARSSSLRGLKWLLLARNRIGDRGARAFLSRPIRSLVRLDLGGNPVSSSARIDLSDRADTPDGREGWQD
jgi:hypothetical protein